MPGRGSPVVVHSPHRARTDGVQVPRLNDAGHAVVAGGEHVQPHQRPHRGGQQRAAHVVHHMDLLQSAAEPRLPRAVGPRGGQVGVLPHHHLPPHQVRAHAQVQAQRQREQGVRHRGAQLLLQPQQRLAHGQEVEQDGDRRRQPARHLERRRQPELPHLELRRQELGERDDGKGDDKVDHHLGLLDHLRRRLGAVGVHDVKGGRDGDEARDEADEPAGQAQLKEALHDVLRAEDARQRAALPRAQHGDREGAARGAAQGLLQQGGALLQGDHAVREEHSARQDEHYQVDGGRDSQAERRLVKVVPEGGADLLVGALNAPREHERRLQVEVGRADRGAEVGAQQLQPDAVRVLAVAVPQPRQQAVRDLGRGGRDERDLHEVRSNDAREEHPHQQLHLADAPELQAQRDEGV
mmetsp:Transcript_46108/g.116719  ORF Transcript_46108/g.116719 Transcript_46108/m.116719 type:complete len:410 (+) Transcript_46108:113-1342(+)